MDHTHSPDIFIIDGVETERPPLIVDGEGTIGGTHSGSVCVHSGSFTIPRGATLAGSLTVSTSARARIEGTHAGSLHIESGATVEIIGSQNGSVSVDENGLLQVLLGGQLAGSLIVHGRIENAGTRGGSVSVRDGQLLDLPGSTVKKPEHGANGAEIYHW